MMDPFFNSFRFIQSIIRLKNHIHIVDNEKNEEVGCNIKSLDLIEPYWCHISL